MALSNIFDNIINGEIDFNNEEEVVTEAYMINDLPYLKTLKRNVLLPLGNPRGKGNLCFLYSHSLDESIDMIKNRRNFVDKGLYPYYYYNTIYIGKIYNKNFRFKEYELRKEYYEKITKNTKLKPRIKLSTSDIRNLYYDLFRYIEIFFKLIGTLQLERIMKLYWSYLWNIVNNINYGNNKFILVDISKYPLGKDRRESITNPLFMIYYTSYRKPELLKDIDIDFLFYNDSRVLKVNPSQFDEHTDKVLKAEMRRLMVGVTSEETIDEITSDKEMEKDEIVDKTMVTMSKIIPVSKPVVITTNEELNKAGKTALVSQEIHDKVKTQAKKATEISGDMNVDTDAVAKQVENNVLKEIESDRELIKKLYYQNKGKEKPKSEASTARDALLKEEQKNITVDGMTIGEISKINSNNIEIPIKDISKTLTTTNEHMKQIRFANLDKTYNEKLMKKDITDAILALNNKSIPMFVRDIKIEDTSDELNYKDTYTILLEDSNRKRHTVKVDIPKFIDDRFLYIGGNKKIIKHQSFYLPVIKIAPDMVQIVTNYSKMSIQRVENKSTSSVERLKKLIASNSAVAELFVPGTAFTNNFNSITTLEYDDLSKGYISFKSGKTYIMFDQIEASDYMQKNNIKPQEKKLFVGMNNGRPCFIDIDNQLDQEGNSIVDIILNSIPEEANIDYASIKAPKRLMYGKVRIMKQFVAVGLLLGFWEGLDNLIKRLNLQYRLEDKVPNNLKPDEEFIKFKDTILVYKQDIPTAIIMNGFRLFDTSKYDMAAFYTKEPYIEYIKKIYGNAIIENALMNFYEFAVDPITLEVCKTMNLPTDIIGLYIYACNLLADSQYTFDICQDLQRIRCNEIIPAILYERLSKNYVTYRNFNGRRKFNVPQDCVIKEILSLKTVEDYSTLNPTLEMEQIHAVSTKGFRGLNLDDAYTMERRGYDPSMTGIIAPSTSPDGSVGISRTLTLEPNITNLRGFTENKYNDLKDVKDVNLFSPGELTIPLGATTDDPNRLGV